MLSPGWRSWQDLAWSWKIMARSRSWQATNLGKILPRYYQYYSILPYLPKSCQDCLKFLPRSLSLKFHVVCTCTFFGDTICLLTNWKMAKIAIPIDLHIVLTYDCRHHCFLVFKYLSESCFGNDNKFLLPNPWIVLFFIYPTFYSLKIVFTQPFSLWCHPSLTPPSA